MAACGFPITVTKLLDTVQCNLNKLGRKTSFKNNRPSRQWANDFRRRHKLSLRITECLDRAKASVQESDITDWMNQLESYLR